MTTTAAIVSVVIAFTLGYLLARRESGFELFALANIVREQNNEIAYLRHIPRLSVTCACGSGPTPPVAASDSTEVITVNP